MTSRCCKVPTWSVPWWFSKTVWPANPNIAGSRCAAMKGLMTFPQCAKYYAAASNAVTERKRRRPKLERKRRRPIAQRSEERRVGKEGRGRWTEPTEGHSAKDPDGGYRDNSRIYRILEEHEDTG